MSWCLHHCYHLKIWMWTAKDNTVYASLEKRDMPSISFPEKGCKKTDANLNQVRKAWAKKGLDMSASSLLPQFTKVTSMKDALRRSMKAVQRQCSSVRKGSLVQLSRNFWGVHQACHLLLLVVVFVFLPGHDSLIKTVRSLEGDLADHNLATDKQRAPSHAVDCKNESRYREYSAAE